MQIERPSEGQKIIPIKWYWAPPGAKTYYGVNAFTSGVWDREKIELPPLLGDQPSYESPHYNGANPWGYIGQCVIGTPADYEFGMTAGELAAPPRPIPNCCRPAPTPALDLALDFALRLPAPRPPLAPLDLALDFAFGEPLPPLAPSAKLDLAVDFAFVHPPPALPLAPLDLALDFGLVSAAPPVPTIRLDLALDVAMVPGLPRPRLASLDLALDFGFVVGVPTPRLMPLDLAIDLFVGAPITERPIAPLDLALDFALVIPAPPPPIAPLDLALDFALVVPAPRPPTCPLDLALDFALVVPAPRPPTLPLDLALDVALVPPTVPGPMILDLALDLALVPPPAATPAPLDLAFDIAMIGGSSLYLGCGACPLGTAHVWRLVMSGATGALSAFNGTWDFAVDTGCTWDCVTAPLVGSCDLVFLPVLTMNFYPLNIGSLFLSLECAPATCLGPNVLTVTASAGGGTPPTSCVATLLS
jgi:hypothetical protein